MSHPFVPIDEPTVRIAQVTGVPGGAEIWNVTVALVPLVVDSNATHSIPDVGSVWNTQPTHAKKDTSVIDAIVQTARRDGVEPPYRPAGGVGGNVIGPFGTL